MKITERLNVEHGIFLEQLASLERLVDEGAPGPLLCGAVQTVAAALASHCRREDELLYPVIHSALGESPALAALRAEHDEVEELVETAASGPCHEEFIHEFAAKLRAHIESEIHFLFPIVEEWIPSETLASNWNIDHIEQSREHAVCSGRARR